MSVRIQPLDHETATGPARDIFDSVKAKIGMVPNLYRVLGHSPAALSAYLSINDRLAQASLPPALREKVALTVSQANGCGYCLSAHTMIADKMLGVPESEILAAREGKGVDARESAVLALAARVVESRGRVSGDELNQARAAGVTEGAIIEVVALVAALTFSNYINHVAGTEIDFPRAPNLPVES